MIQIYTLNENVKWDEIIRSFIHYDVYWLSGYVKAFKIHGDGEPLLFYYESTTASTVSTTFTTSIVRGINVVMKRDIAKDLKFHGRLKEGLYYDLSTPYGYGGWIIESAESAAESSEASEGAKVPEEINRINRNELANLFNEYVASLNNLHIISEFVRFHPMLKNHIECENFYHVIQLGEVIHMDLESPEAIWNNVTSKNRNMIRKAEKNNIKVYNGRYPDIYKEFREIYNATMDKDGAEKYYYFGESFYESVLEDLPENAQIFYAEKDGVIIAASIILTANGFMNYHLSGSLKDFRSLAPTNLILYKAALWGCANGYKSFYLGGGVGSNEDSLFKFKRAFYKGVLNHFYIGQKIYDQEVYDKLLNIRLQSDNISNNVAGVDNVASISESKFFPKYRG